MTALILLTALTISPNLLQAPGVGRFGTPYFRDIGHEALQEKVLERWPGPSGLLELWQSGELKRNQKIALLLGGAAFHDPLLLPAYREGLAAKDARIRQAAAFGYRDLIGEDPPNVFRGFSLQHAAALTRELDAIASTVRENSLVDLWLTAALAAENRAPPGWRGVIMKRDAASCLRALNRLVHPEDLEIVVEAYHLARSQNVRIGLVRIIERLSLRVFLQIPQGEAKGWGPDVYDLGFDRLDQWLADNCDLEPNRVLNAGFEGMGLQGVHPFEAQGCSAWLLVMDQAVYQWWPLAAEQVYSCGGPAVDFSAGHSSEDKNKAKRNRIKDWYGR